MVGHIARSAKFLTKYLTKFHLKPRKKISIKFFSRYKIGLLDLMKRDSFDGFHRNCWNGFFSLGYTRPDTYLERILGLGSHSRDLGMKSHAFLSHKDRVKGIAYFSELYLLLFRKFLFKYKYSSFQRWCLIFIPHF